MELKYELECILTMTRFGINFFGTRADQWYYLVQDTGNDDEYHLTVTIVKGRNIGQCVMYEYDCITFHILYFVHIDLMTKRALLAKYHTVFEEYELKQFFPTTPNNR